MGLGMTGTAFAGDIGYFFGGCSDATLHGSYMSNGTAWIIPNTTDKPVVPTPSIAMGWFDGKGDVTTRVSGGDKQRIPHQEPMPSTETVMA
jgi:hypothetical protein